MFLTLLQIDPTAAVAPNADLVAWSRLGESYQPTNLTQALEQDNSSPQTARFMTREEADERPSR